MQEARGCDDKAITPVWKGRDGKPRYRCPIASLTADTRMLLNVYNFYKEGFLFNVGAVANQSNVFIQTVRVLDDEVGMLTREREEARERKRKREAAKGPRGRGRRGR